MGKSWFENRTWRELASTIGFIKVVPPFSSFYRDYVKGGGGLKY